MPAITIDGGSSTPVLRAHLAVPPVGEGPFPGVVVLHDAFGLSDDTRQQADRLAAAGHVVVAPALYSAGGLGCLRATFRDLQAGDGPAFGDIEVARRWLAARDDCTGRIGVLGFCMGGGFALYAATRGFEASAPNYGLMPDDPTAALVGACPTVASFGARDVALRGAAERLAAALEANGVEHDVVEYPGAGHAFMDRPASGPLAVLERLVGMHYHEPSAEHAWGRILRFFDEHLGAPPG